MGIPYLTTFIEQFLFLKKDPSKHVNLTNQNFIIDGYSLFYFAYYELEKEDKDKPLTQRITDMKFAYDGLTDKFRKILKQFQSSYANVEVVFDGIKKSNEYLRPDPKRDSSIKFNEFRRSLSPLLHVQLKYILRDLDIKCYIAPDEADPMIVQMARNQNAFIVARDSDYFLYGNTKGYIPLNTLKSSSPEAEFYYMEDVFNNMTQRGVALWATTMAYDLIKLEVLQVDFFVIQ